MRGLGFEPPKKSSGKDDDRGSAFASWNSKSSGEKTPNQWASWKKDADKKCSNAGNNPWGPVFKDRQSFVDMHLH